MKMRRIKGEKLAALGMAGYMVKGKEIPPGLEGDRKEIYVINEHLRILKKHPIRNAESIKEKEKMLFELAERIMRKGETIPEEVEK